MIQRLKKWFSDEIYYYFKRLTAKYYIISRQELGAGFFSNYYWVMGHVVFAYKLGYIPVVDMDNYKTLYSESEPVDGETNAWNYYFENVGTSSLLEAYQSRKYVFAKKKPLDKYADKFCSSNYRFPSDKAIDLYNPIMSRYLKIKPTLLQSFEIEWSQKCRNADSIIGVHVRGTDMQNNLGHPMPAKLESYFAKIRELLENDKTVNTIFLASDEKKVIAEFKREFEKEYTVLFNDAFRSDIQEQQHKTGIHEQIVENPRALHKYKMGLEVLKDAYFLNKCDYLICGHSNITNVVIIWNNHRFKKIVCVEA